MNYQQIVLRCVSCTGTRSRGSCTGSHYDWLTWYDTGLQATRAWRLQVGGRFRCQLIIDSWLPVHDTWPLYLHQQMKLDFYKKFRCRRRQRSIAILSVGVKYSMLDGKCDAVDFWDCSREMAKISVCDILIGNQRKERPRGWKNFFIFFYLFYMNLCPKRRVGECLLRWTDAFIRVSVWASSELASEWARERLSEWLNERVSAWVSELLCECGSERMSERPSELST